MTPRHVGVAHTRARSTAEKRVARFSAVPFCARFVRAKSQAPVKVLAISHLFRVAPVPNLEAMKLIGQAFVLLAVGGLACSCGRSNAPAPANQEVPAPAKASETVVANASTEDPVSPRLRRLNFQTAGKSKGAGDNGREKYRVLFADGEMPTPSCKPKASKSATN